MEYILFQCMQCKKMMAYPERTSDGHKCNHCNGMLKQINKGTREGLGNIIGIEFSTDRKKHRKFMIDISEADRVSIGSRIYDMLDGSNMYNKLHRGAGSNELILLEEDIVEMWKLVNPFWAGTIKLRIQKGS